MTNGQPSYPPSILGSLQAIDLQLLAALENMVQSKMNETEQAYRRDLQARDEAWQRHEQEFQAHEVAFQAKLQVVSDVLRLQSPSMLSVFSWYLAAPDALQELKHCNDGGRFDYGLT